MGTLRTILRRIFYTAATLSTLLLLATLILWPVCYYRQAIVAYTTGWGMEYDLGCYGDRAVVRFVTARTASGPAHRSLQWAGGKIIPENEDHWSYLTWHTHDPVLGPVYNYWGVGWTFAGSFRIGDWLLHLFIPFSYLVLLFSILPLLAFRSIRRRRRARRNARIGLCPKCGYDLRAQHAGAGGAVCPECGTRVAKCGMRNAEC